MMPRTTCRAMTARPRQSVHKRRIRFSVMSGSCRLARCPASGHGPHVRRCRPREYGGVLRRFRHLPSSGGASRRNLGGIRAREHGRARIPRSRSVTARRGDPRPRVLSAHQTEPGNHPCRKADIADENGECEPVFCDCSRRTDSRGPPRRTASPTRAR